MGFTVFAAPAVVAVLPDEPPLQAARSDPAAITASTGSTPPMVGGGRSDKGSGSTTAQAEGDQDEGAEGQEGDSTNSSSRNGSPVSPEVAPAMAVPEAVSPEAVPEEAVPVAPAAVVATGAVTSTTGSLVMEKLAEPAWTDAPVAACSPLPVTRYTVEPAVMAGEVMVTRMAGNVPVTFDPLT